MTTLRVRVNPRSSHSRITGWQDGVLHIKLTAPPVEGAANKAAVEFLAKTLGVRKSQVTLVSGQTGRDKTFEVAGLAPEELHRRITEVSSL